MYIYHNFLINYTVKLVILKLIFLRDSTTKFILFLIKNMYILRLTQTNNSIIRIYLQTLNFEPYNDKKFNI